MDDTMLAEIKRLDAERQPGKWIKRLAPGNSNYMLIGENDNANAEDYEPVAVFTANGRNVAFIAGASWAIPALVAEIERLRALLPPDNTASAKVEKPKK